MDIFFTAKNKFTFLQELRIKKNNL
jgi:hypothetical protein